MLSRLLLYTALIVPTRISDTHLHPALRGSRSPIAWEWLVAEQRQAELQRFDDMAAAEAARPKIGFRVVESSAAASSASASSASSSSADPNSSVSANSSSSGSGSSGNGSSDMFSAFKARDAPPRGDTLLTKVPNLTVAQLGQLLPWCTFCVGVCCVDHPLYAIA